MEAATMADAERVVVTPDAEPKGDEDHLYLMARKEGPGTASVFAVDVLLKHESDGPKPTFPREFEFRGERKVLVNRDGSAAKFDWYRFWWDSKRPPLFAGVEEPVSREPIKLRLNKLAFGLFVVQTIGPSFETYTGIYRFTQPQEELLHLTMGQVEVTSDSDKPWFRLRA
jgi:hypothetical protein